MSSSRHQKSDTSDDPMQQVLESVHRLAQQHWRHVLVVVLGLIAVLLGYQSWRTQNNNERAMTWQKLNEMPSASAMQFRQDGAKRLQNTITTCKTLLNERWQTSATPWVLLKLANAQVHSDKLGPAKETLAKLNRDFPDHYSNKMARELRAGVEEDLEQYSDAAGIYRALAQDKKASARYWVDTGRAEEMGKHKKSARTAYAKAIDHSTDKQTRSVAIFRKTMIERGEDMLPPVPSPPVPSIEDNPDGDKPAQPANDTEVPPVELKREPDDQ